MHTDFLLFGGQRLGIYFLEQGVGIKAANVIYDRAFSSFSQMAANEWKEWICLQELIYFIYQALRQL